MNSTELNTFVAVADCLSFSRAAIKLQLTQPAVSKRIQALEAHLGMALFDRPGKRVYLTDAGRLLQPRAEAMLQSLADTERLLQNLNNRIEGALRLATSHHVGLHRLAPVLKSFTRDHAAVKLDIRFEDSEAAHDLVRHADSELAVVTLDPKGGSDLDIARSGTIRCVLWSPRNTHSPATNRSRCNRSRANRSSCRVLPLIPAESSPRFLPRGTSPCNP